MDQRQTFVNNEELLTILLTIQNDKSHVALLIDRNGLTRVDGNIKAIQ